MILRGDPMTNPSFRRIGGFALSLSLAAVTLCVSSVGCGDGGVTSEPVGPIPPANLPLCGERATPSDPLPDVVPSSGVWPWPGTRNVFELVEKTGDGWSVTVDSGAPSSVTAVRDEGHLLDYMKAGDRIDVFAYVECVPFSGCKSYHVVTDAADGSLIAAAYDHDQALLAFSAALGGKVWLQPTCRSEKPDTCYPDGFHTFNALWVAGNATPVEVGTTTSVVVAGTTVRVRATLLDGIAGGSLDTISHCGTDAGALFRGHQTFQFAR